MTDPTDLPAGTTWGDVARLFDEAANDPHATDEERRQNAKTRDEIVAKGPNFLATPLDLRDLGGALLPGTAEEVRRQARERGLID